MRNKVSPHTIAIKNERTQEEAAVIAEWSLVSLTALNMCVSLKCSDTDPGTGQCVCVCVCVRVHARVCSSPSYQ